MLFNISNNSNPHLTFMVHYQSALQQTQVFVFDIKHSHSPCSHLIHILQPRHTWNDMLCIYKHRTVSQAPGDHLQSPLPHSMHFLLWPSLDNRLETEQRAKKQLRNRDARPPAASAPRAIHWGRTAISNKERCSVILHKHIILSVSPFPTAFFFLTTKRRL